MLELSLPTFLLMNHTDVNDFILLGISELPELRIPLFVLLLIIYLATMCGNLLIILLIRFDSHLHTAMYFFLCQLSIMDICSSSVTVPKMLMNLILNQHAISFHGCIAQFSFFIYFACSECLLLSAMAYDRHVAICYPLRYGTIMNEQLCIHLVAGSWVGGFLYSMLHTLTTRRLSFCGPRRIQHFFCDVPQVFKLSCIDPFVNMVLVFISGGIMGLGSFIITIISYIYIIAAILRISSKKGRGKAFSTCTSHLTVVTFYYGAMFFTYFRPVDSYAMAEGRLLSVIYTVITPVLNPLIYTLRNQEIKGAVKRVLWTDKDSVLPKQSTLDLDAVICKEKGTVWKQMKKTRKRSIKTQTSKETKDVACQADFTMEQLLSEALRVTVKIQSTDAYVRWPENEWNFTCELCKVTLDHCYFVQAPTVRKLRQS
ncbi:olfactory receptor 5J3-like [Ambystoma mexicanum]|uniref:olfactory receptor 5J3-like n=1 Tax=Ambystoma mexicanum TaxID=8296 RepID=UPI0037E99371